MSKKFTPYPWGNDSSKPRGSSRVFPALPAAALAAAVILAACEPPATPTIVDPPVTVDSPAADAPPVTVDPPTADAPPAAAAPPTAANPPAAAAPPVPADLSVPDDPPTVPLTFRDTEVRKSRILFSTNGSTTQTFTNELRLGTTPVTAGVTYAIIQPPDYTGPITLDPATGAVSFGREAYIKVIRSGTPERVTVQATHQDRTASFTFTVTDHFKPRQDHASAVLNGELYVVGGYRPGGSVTDEVWRSADGGRTWDQVAAGPRFSRRGHHTLEVIGDALYILGGEGYEDGDRKKFNEVWKSADRGVTWRQVATTPRYPARYDHSSAVLGDNLYLIGGSLKFADPNDEIWRSTDLGATWTRVPETIEGVVGLVRFRRNGHASVVVGNRAYVIGGFQSGAGFDLSNDVWQSPTPISAAGNWTQVVPNGTMFSARRDHSAVVLNGAIYVMGGYGDDYKKLGDVWKSTDQGVTWTQEAATGDGFGARSSHSSAELSGEIYVIGGNRAGDGLGDDVWKSTDQGVTWTNVHANP